MSTNKVCSWEHFSHDADIGIRGIGDSVTSAFVQAAVALTAVICDVKSVKPLMPIEIICKASDIELLFVDWLNALIYHMAVEKMLFSLFEIEINDHVLRATAWGEPVNQKRHQPAVEVKGATFTELSVRRSPDDHWIVQCVIDV